MLAATLAATALFCTAEQVNVVTVNQTDGKQSHFAVDSRPHVYFTPENVEIHLQENAGNAILFPLDSFASFSYGTQDRTVTASDQIESVSEAFFRLTPEAIEAEGLKAGSTITVHAVNGILVGSATVAADGSARISIADAPQGICIVKSDNSTFKFLKR